MDGQGKKFLEHPILIDLLGYIGLADVKRIVYKDNTLLDTSLSVTEFYP